MAAELVARLAAFEACSLCSLDCQRLCMLVAGAGATDSAGLELGRNGLTGAGRSSGPKLGEDKLTSIFLCRGGGSSRALAAASGGESRGAGPDCLGESRGTGPDCLGVCLGESCSSFTAVAASVAWRRGTGPSCVGRCVCMGSGSGAAGSGALRGAPHGGTTRLVGGACRACSVRGFFGAVGASDVLGEESLESSSPTLPLGARACCVPSAGGYVETQNLRSSGPRSLTNRTSTPAYAALIVFR